MLVRRLLVDDRIMNFLSFFVLYVNSCVVMRYCVYGEVMMYKMK